MKEVKKDIYHLMHPRMVVFITSRGNTKPKTRDWKPQTEGKRRNLGQANVMAAAWTTPVSEEPPIVAIALWGKGTTQKLIREGKEFVINIPQKSQVNQLIKVGSVHGNKVNKFEKFGIGIGKAKKVKAPIVLDCIGYLECRLWKTVKVGECFVFFGKVVSAYADERHFRKGEWGKTAKIPFHLSGKKMAYW